MKKIKHDVLIANLFGFSVPTYYNWKREKRPIISLINSLYTEEEIQEFLDTNKINKFKELEEFNRFKKTKDYEEFKLFLEFNEFKKNKK
jgi:hypothetical protein